MSVQVERELLNGTPALTFQMTSLSDVGKVLFLGDLHWDHPQCDRRALKRVLDEAVSEGYWIALLGDTFCAMQVTGDKRGSKESVRAEHQRNDYLTALIDTAVEWFQPYAANLWLVLHGNHETSVLKHHNVDLVRHFVGGLGSEALAPGYSSYAMLRLRRQSQRSTVPLWLAHGHGGGGPVTKGVIQAQRRAVTFPDARIVVSGHIHNSYFVAHEQHRLLSNGRVYATEQEHYVVSSFKNEFKNGSGGWHVERGGGPVIPSGWFADFRFVNALRGDVHWDFRRAK